MCSECMARSKIGSPSESNLPESRFPVQSPRVSSGRVSACPDPKSVARKSLVNIAAEEIIAELGVFQHFGEASLTAAARRAFLRESGMSGKVKLDLRNASVMAKNDDVQVLKLEVGDLETVLSSGAVDLQVLKKSIEEQHLVRQSLTAARRLWNKSDLRKELQKSRARAGKSITGRSLFD